MAMRPPSFTDLLPYLSYQADEKIFVLKDGATLGAMFELGAVATEAQSMSYLIERASKVQEALQAIPENDGSPWIVQFFLNDDRNIDGLNQYLRDYIAEQHRRDPERAKAILESPYTTAVLEEFRKHLALVSRPEGLFTDTQVTGQTWRGQQRRVRCCIYKRFGKVSDDPTPGMAQMEAMAITLEATLLEAGVTARRCGGRDLYEWLLPFFNRKVPWAKDAAELLRTAPYPGDTVPPGDREGVGGTSAPMMDWDLAGMLNLSEPRSDLEAGLFEFDGMPVKALTLQGLRIQPSIGHFSAELRSGNESFARFDRLPAGSMLSISLTVEPQYKLERHIERIRDASRAKTAMAYETHKECEMVLARMIDGDKLYPMMMTLYITGNNVGEVDAAISQANALLIPTGLRFVAPRQDLVPLDAFVRGLPFNFDPAFDNRNLRRARLTFASQIAALLPVYGRARGTPHPGMWFWNRGGEPIWMDPLNRLDRKKNAHMLVLGPTGSGKSATLNYQAMLTMAVHRPRLVIADAGRSFALLLDYFKSLGLSTHSVTLTTDAQVSLPPFVHALRLLQDPDVMESYHAAEKQARSNVGLPDEERMEQVLRKATTLLQDGDDEAALDGAHPAKGDAGQDGDDDEGSEKRDLLGEMLIAAIMMITGSEAREVSRLSRADRYLITRAIIRAAVNAKSQGKAHPLTHDVAIELMSMHKDPTLSLARQSRAEEMGQSMMSFTQGLRGKLFNRPGSDWPDVDVTLVEMGTLTQDGYNDALAVAYSSLIDSVQSRGERAQSEDRPLVFLTDEGHLITTNDLLGPKIAKGTKMWRKLNIWFWLATQNLKDFPNSMDRVLSMCEYWMLLTMDKSEIEDVSRFRSLSAEQRLMMESARKEPGKYTEGVIINASGQFLFRNVPPALPIALAMTEGHEKAHRRRLMDRHGCTELEAAYMVARELEVSRDPESSTT
ncbi:conjugative transfer ATPase [Variovorax sp. ZS18.2.2]|uniref:conjugative transfer ATPase n=1 Tax=Variovorax sp. ZS18.2.2 TaxID=2971255 RepID=UPI0035ADA905